jgi:hypothetical protein
MTTTTFIAALTLAAGIALGGSTLTAPRAITADAPASPVLISLVDEQDPEDTGACIHSVSTARMCNEITRRYCFSVMFVAARFYEGYTCDDAKREGLY